MKYTIDHKFNCKCSGCHYVVTKRFTVKHLDKLVIAQQAIIDHNKKMGAYND